MRSALGPARVAEQRARESNGPTSLADAGRAVEEVRVRRPLGERRREQALRLLLLGKALEAHPRRFWQPRASIEGSCAEYRKEGRFRAQTATTFAQARFCGEPGEDLLSCGISSSLRSSWARARLHFSALRPDRPIRLNRRRSSSSS